MTNSFKNKSTEKSSDKVFLNKTINNKTANNKNIDNKNIDNKIANVNITPKTVSSKIKSLSLCGILSAIALTIFVIEAQLPVPLPIPGIKLGLANIVTLFALLYLNPKEALMILITRIVLGSVFASAPTVIPYSLCGGLPCFFAEVFMIKIFGKSYICEISVVGAIIHNFGQLCCAAAVVKSLAVFSYIPVLVLCGGICGAFCGLCIKFFDRTAGEKIKKILH